MKNSIQMRPISFIACQYLRWISLTGVCAWFCKAMIADAAMFAPMLSPVTTSVVPVTTRVRSIMSLLTCVAADENAGGCRYDIPPLE